MSNILKRRLNDIQDDIAALTRFARNRAEGDQWVDQQGFIELHIRCIKEQLDGWYSSCRKLHPRVPKEEHDE